MSTPTQNTAFSQRVILSGDEYLDSLVRGVRWAPTGNGTTLTYSFPGATSSWAPSYSQLNEPSGVQPLNAAEIEAARSVLQTWARYINLTFNETSDTPTNVGDIRFAYTTVNEPSSAAHAYLPADIPVGGDVWLDRADIDGSFEPGSGGYFTLLHEVGHALGLKHPFESLGDNANILDPAFDSVSYTIMSYNLYEGISIGDHALTILPTTPMMLDIYAMQFLYGVGSHNAGDTRYDYYEDQDYFETIYDTGGNDTIVWHSDEQFAIIDLTGGYWSSLGNALLTFDIHGDVVKADIYNVMIFPDSVIENVVSGGSDDDIYGNSAANHIDAGGGHDYVWGDAGADTVLGGDGNDHLYGQSPYGGSDGADSLSGGNGADYLQGNAGNDTLDGGAGSDRINGGANDDIIQGGSDNDTINGNLGADTIGGGDGNDSLRGGQGDDMISGGAGHDVLSGDLGGDILTGGDGRDRFLFSGTGSLTSRPDRITDFQSGTDWISLGFVPMALLTGSAQGDATTAAGTAQQLFNGRDGNGEVAVLTVGGDTYVFYASGGGSSVDSAIILTGANVALTLADFG